MTRRTVPAHPRPDARPPRSPLTPGLLAAAALLLVAAPSPARTAASPAGSETKRVERTVDAGDRLVRLTAHASDVEVGPGADGVVRVVAELEYWSNREEWMEAVERGFDVDVRESAGAIEIEPTSLADLEERGWLARLLERERVSWSLAIRLEVPPGTPLEIENRYGDVALAAVGGSARVHNTSGRVEVDGARGGVEVDNRYGDLAIRDAEGSVEARVASGRLTVEDVSGRAELDARYGDVEIRRVSGGLRLAATSGSLSVAEVGGRAEIESSYGDVAVEGVGGDLELDATSGSVRVAGVGGDLDLGASYGSVEVADVDGDLAFRGSSSGGEIRDVGGRVDAETSYADLLVTRVGRGVRVDDASGGVTVDGAGGDVEIAATYGAIRARDVDGSLTVRGQSAPVWAEAIAGPVTVETTYDAVVVDGAGGAVTVRNQSGRVSVSGLRGDALAARHAVATSYADAEVAWPATAPPPSFRLEASYGRAASDFPGHAEERGSRRFLSSEGDAAPRVEITVQSGSAHLRRR